MPESKKRKSYPKVSFPKERKSPLAPLSTPEPARPEYAEKRDVAREIPEEDRFPLPELPEPADYLQVLVALSNFDPLAQEVMIAERIAVLPSQKDGGMPVNIPRMVRPAWAHNLRKLGVFVIPELATHELVAPDATGMMINHTAGTMRQIDRGDLWEKAKAMNPDLGKLVDEAETPEQKKEAMKILAAKLPAEQRIALDRLMATNPADLEPT